MKTSHETYKVELTQDHVKIEDHHFDEGQPEKGPPTATEIIAMSF